MTAKEIISKISDGLFLNEPLMFDVLCTHQLEENPNMMVMFRTGQGKIQYNPLIMENSNYNVVEEKFKIELVRIILKHPYERVPELPNRRALAKASDITIRENTEYSQDLTSPEYYNLLNKQSYEEYYKVLKTIIDDDQQNANSNNQSDSGGLTDLWGEDERTSEKIHGAIKKAEKSNQWGSIPGEIMELIKADQKVEFPYASFLSRFRKRITSSNRKLTRLRPNRRFGYEYMGSRNQDNQKLLVAIDDSGSISDEDLSKFFSIINRFFKQGLDKMRVIVFDTEIQQEYDLKKAKKEVKIK